MKLGVDTGGTFTDFLLQDGVKLKRYKCHSTPADPSVAILQGIAYFFPEGAPPHLEIVHGTTVGTNAFVERKGGSPLLITTKGFEDILALGRQNRASLFDLEVTRPPLILHRDHIIGITERIDANGEVVVALNQSEVQHIKTRLTDLKVDTIVICFLNSFLNDSHEKMVQALLADLAIPVLCSVDVLPEFREFERCSTAIINGYLAPVMASYIDRLIRAIDDQFLSVQQSNGGVMAASAVCHRAVHTLLSGPAAGVQCAYQLSQLKGQGQIITFDMGGTSTDVSLCHNGLTLTKEYVLDGYPISIPMLDINTVGAGGGSIAYLDKAGVLHVGPQSAGADPGPVCYGEGVDLTVTDANLLLGRLLPDSFLAGAIVLDVARAHRYAQQMAQQLCLTVDELCLGIIAIVNAEMVKAVRTVSLDRGHDPSDFTLYSYGGSSGLHCCELAESLGVLTIEIPARAGVLSAQGLVFSPLLLDQTKALFLQDNECSFATIHQQALLLEEEVKQNISTIAITDNIVTESFVDMRYAGQSHEISIPVAADMLSHFHQKHKQMFGYQFNNQALECVALRSVARQVQDVQRLPSMPIQSEKNKPVCISVIITNVKIKIPMYNRADIQKKWQVGPCLIVDDYTTILVTSSFKFKVDQYGALTLKRI